MRLLLLNCAISLLILFHPVINAVDIENGKTLHNENCTRCHQPDIYTHENSMIHSYTELNERIRQCEIMAEMAWFDDEINDVTAYLNETYYKFELDK